MEIRQLKLSHFKTHDKADFHFHSKITAITGRNGLGKTNLLDAIHHVGLVRSAFHKQDAQSISFGENFYRIDAQLVDNQEKPHRFELVYSLEEKKKLLWDGLIQEKVTDHIGRIPLVFILPDEPFLMLEHAEWRRNFIDNTLSQAFPSYLFHLGRFKRLLNQRNALLKYFAERKTFDALLLETLDQELAQEAIPVWKIRKNEMPKLITLVQNFYAQMSESQEVANLEHETEQDAEDFLYVLAKSRTLDLESQRTQSGPHRDDYNFLLNGRSLKKTGSQGQQKSYLLSLKMAQYQFIAEIKGVFPWLLLDDIFDRLDDFRIARLMELVSAKNTGQIFISDARSERTKQLMNRGKIEFDEILLS